MGLGDDSQNLHGINTTASRKTLPVTAQARSKQKSMHYYMPVSGLVEIAATQAPVDLAV
jgi:hypothetical protein